LGKVENMEPVGVSKNKKKEKESKKTCWNKIP
jgi:hypothetical protein